LAGFDSAPYRNHQESGNIRDLHTNSMVLRSSPAQQNVAQPRQVRKEATVGKEFCVTQGSLTSFVLERVARRIASVGSPEGWLDKTVQTLTHLFSQVFLYTLSLIRSQGLTPDEQAFSRCGRTPLHVVSLNSLQEIPGPVPLRHEALCLKAHHPRLKWIESPYEKRHYHQFDGERTPHRHT